MLVRACHSSLVTAEVRKEVLQVACRMPGQAAAASHQLGREDQAIPARLGTVARVQLNEVVGAALREEHQVQHDRAVLQKVLVQQTAPMAELPAKEHPVEAH